MTIARFVVPLVFLALLSGVNPVCYADNIGIASYYSTEACKYNPTKDCQTASGKSLYILEAEGMDYAAMWYVPFGTQMTVTNLANGKSVIKKPLFSDDTYYMISALKQFGVKIDKKGSSIIVYGSNGMLLHPKGSISSTK